MSKGLSVRVSNLRLSKGDMVSKGVRLTPEISMRDYNE